MAQWAPLQIKVSIPKRARYFADPFSEIESESADCEISLSACQIVLQAYGKRAIRLTVNSFPVARCQESLVFLDQLHRMKTMCKALLEQSGEGLFIPMIDNGRRSIDKSIASLKDPVRQINVLRPEEFLIE